MIDPIARNVPGCKTEVRRFPRQWRVYVNGHLVAVIPIRGATSLLDV